jgi:hypothetical protein
MRNILTVMSALAVASSPAFALESVTTGSQATQATVGAINSKVDVTNNFINSMMKCNAARKFYAPSDPKKDSDGCVGVGDYDLNMASGSNVHLANGQVVGTQTTAGWAGSFAGPYGVYAQSPNYSLYAYNTGNNNWTGRIDSNSSPYGLYVHTATSGAYGLYIDNPNNNAQLCLNGNCTTALPRMGSYTWPNSGPGAYALWTGPYSFVCPGNQVVVGLAITTAGTCSNKCNGDGPIIRSIQLICR